ncbi:hypothetical protein ACHAXT_002737 [Thalassiosira profunda]
MIIRIQTNAGQWRVESATPSSTVRDVLSEIATKYPGYSCGRLAFDQAGMRPIPSDGLNTLDELGLRHGSMIYCRVAEVGATAALSSVDDSSDAKCSAPSDSNQNASKKRSNESIDLTDESDDTAPPRNHLPNAASSRHHRLQMGTFQGVKLYRNRLNPGETFDNDHVSLANLIPADCERAIVTTFQGPEHVFIEETFGCDDLTIRDLLVVRHDTRKGQDGNKLPGFCVLGEAELRPISAMDGVRNWHYVTCGPHTSGCLHGKLLLFRSRSAGLRVVVSGNNFHKSQWEMDRDALWVQDFEFAEKNGGKGAVGPFGSRLIEFMERITTCRQENHSVQQRVKALFEGVDFSGARGRLVYSFPTSKEKRGGWTQLANAVRELRDELESDPDSDTDSSLGSERKAKKPRRSSSDDDCDRPSGKKTDNAILNAISGSMGDVKPDFLLHMHRAMMGLDWPVSKETEWEHIMTQDEPQIGLIRCLWPSMQRALTMSIRSVCCGRAISTNHWHNGIPEKAKRRFFFDAPPNPPQMGLAQLRRHARAHGKVMCMTIPRETSSGYKETTVLYVGSHNFSKAAWGVHGNQPMNVEIGVVLASSSPSVAQQWRESLPCILPGEYDQSPADYVPANTTQDVKNLCMDGRDEEAQQMFRKLVEAMDITTDASQFDQLFESGVAQEQPMELIDLCDSE